MRLIIYTQECSSGLWYCVRTSGVVLAAAVETGEKLHRRVSATKASLYPPKEILVNDIAWLALTLILQVIFRIMITKNGCICRHFEVWRRKWALPIDMAKEDIWVGLGKEVGTDQTWVSVIKQR